jgi:beta-glucanase (GH16 family)
MITKTSTSFILACFALVCFLGFSSCRKLTTIVPPSVKDTISKTVHVIPDYDFNDATLTNDGWTKTFEDNFDGDLSKWRTLTGGVQNELACYQPANVKIANGVLQLSVKKETVTGPAIVDTKPTKTFDYSSGWMVCKSTISASTATPRVRIVSRIKVASGYGLTSVLYSFGGDWPTNGEIDFLLVKGSNTSELLADYSYGTTSFQDLVKGGLSSNIADGDLSGAFHVYELEWSQSSLKTYLDGKLIETKTAGGYIPGMFGKTQYLSLNLPVGGLYYKDLIPANIQTGSIQVDYIKVFTSK